MLNDSRLDGSPFQMVVYGGTPGGIVAAISAAKAGLKVALVEPGRHVGGMMSGGLGNTDVGNAAVIGGMSREFFQRVGAFYGRDLAWQFEPHVAEQVFIHWLNESHVNVFLGRRVATVVKEGQNIVHMIAENGDDFRADVFIDASYEGDLMARSGITYTVGREGKTTYGESLAGRQPDGLEIPFSPYDQSGNLLPLVSAADTAASGEGDRKVQAYTFRLCMTRSVDRVPFVQPAGYTPDRYEILRRYLVLKGGTLQLNDLVNLSTLPNGKTDTNNRGPISTDFLGGSWEYPDADYARRQQIWEEHKRYVQGFFYFLAHDPSVPPGLQYEVSLWGLARDEFADNENWPYQLYIREGRRMTGAYVMTEADLLASVSKADSVGMGSYNFDCHAVQRNPGRNGGVTTEGLFEVGASLYQIPYRLLTPKSTECQNLMVTSSVSASHVAYSSLRMEPQYMILGQAAGQAAMLAIRDKVAVQNINVAELQDRLRAQGQVLVK